MLKLINNEHKIFYKKFLFTLDTSYKYINFLKYYLLFDSLLTNFQSLNYAEQQVLCQYQCSHQTHFVY